jgi:hypothetical protein
MVTEIGLINSRSQNSTAALTAVKKPAGAFWVLESNSVKIIMGAPTRPIPSPYRWPPV